MNRRRSNNRYETPPSPPPTSSRSPSFSPKPQTIKKIDWSAHDIPESYIYDPLRAEPVLDNLSTLVQSHAELHKKKNSRDNMRSSVTRKDTEIIPDLTLSELLETANKDIDIHRKRQQAVITSNPSILQKSSSTLSKQPLDNTFQARQKYTAQLLANAPKILAALDLPPSRHSTSHTDAARERLNRWKDALEIYVHAPHDETSEESTLSDIDLLGLLEKLCEKCNEEEELLEALSAASQMCTSILEHTCEKVKEISDKAVQVEDTYRIKLQAHKIFTQQTTAKSVDVGEYFYSHGKAAMQIGQQLERAETKRRQCETASLLLRRWWTMESLAEQEEISGVPIKVTEEVRGLINQTSCRMDPLFTRRENGLEAAKALKQLRLVVKSRGNTANIGIGSAIDSGIMIDATSIRRFELTRNLIMRTGDILEQRLLNDFSEVFGRGGTYHFNSASGRARSGTLDWRKLKDLAEALMYFENGRNLFKKYVDLVISSKFPDLMDDDSDNEGSYTPSAVGSRRKTYVNNNGRDDDASESSEEFDMDNTTIKLSQLFHRVSEVCKAEFELISHVFSSTQTPKVTTEPDKMVVPDPVPLQVSRLLLQRVISDPQNGLQALINDLLAQADRRSDFDAASKKLDIFVVIHEKAASLFCLLRDAATQYLIPQAHSDSDPDNETEQDAAVVEANENAVVSLVHFLTSQEMALSDGHRRGYLNLELRLLHHRCCSNFKRVRAKLLEPQEMNEPDDKLLSSVTNQIEYHAPSMPLDKGFLLKGGLAVLLDSVLKGQALRQPLIDATESLERANLMFGGGQGLGGTDADSTARVINAIYSQMCNFYGNSYLYPIIEVLGKMLDVNHPTSPPSLPFNESLPAHNLGVDGKFWVAVERVHSAAKAFDRELWAEQRSGSSRVWEILLGTGSQMILTLAKERRLRLFRELEEKGEATIHRALDTLSRHAHWILVTGGESMLATGGSRLLQNLTGSSTPGAGPYSIPTQNSLEASNSPAVKSLTFCLRAQFVNVQAALTAESLSSFWTALSMRIYDILCARLLQHYSVSIIGAAILSRDVEALRMVAMLAGTNHSHWDTLKELLTLYMTPPEALKTILVGKENGLFAHAGREKSLVFMSRRTDFRVKTNAGWKKSVWARDLFKELNILKDPTEGNINIALYAAERKNKV